MNNNYDIVVIGGSSGSIPFLIRLFQELPAGFLVPIVVVVHRMKNVKSEMTSILSGDTNIHEPEDKERITPGSIYLAPQNYHLLVEDSKEISLDYSELVNFSRPSIDVSFGSIADVYKKGAAAILLSGANSDGAEGVRQILSNGGMAIVQDPATCESPAMPQAAIRLNPNVLVYTPEKIKQFLFSLQIK